MDFYTPAAIPREEEVCHTEDGYGMWPQTSNLDCSADEMQAGTGGSFRSWLDMDRVDPCQPTQSRNVGVGRMQEGNGQWPRAHSDSFRPSCGDVDDCVETGEHIVDVGLTLQGQLY